MVYEFLCLACKALVELECKMSEYDEKKKEMKCPECGGPVNRVISPVMSLVKGKYTAANSYGLKEGKKK